MSSVLVDTVIELLPDSSIVDHAVDEDVGTMYTTIYSTSTLEQVKAVVRAQEKDGYGRGCSHEHDCCGCWFLSMIFVLPLFQDQKDYYIIKEVWAQNI